MTSCDDECCNHSFLPPAGADKPGEPGPRTTESSPEIPPGTPVRRREAICMCIKSLPRGSGLGVLHGQFDGFLYHLFLRHLTCRRKHNTRYIQVTGLATQAFFLKLNNRKCFLYFHQHQWKFVLFEHYFSITPRPIWQMVNL